MLFRRTAFAHAKRILLSPWVQCNRPAAPGNRQATTLVCARPASTTRFCPVIPRASSDARNSAARATSSSQSLSLRHC